MKPASSIATDAFMSLVMGRCEVRWTCLCSASISAPAHRLLSPPFPFCNPLLAASPSDDKNAGAWSWWLRPRVCLAPSRLLKNAVGERSLPAPCLSASGSWGPQHCLQSRRGVWVKTRGRARIAPVNIPPPSFAYFLLHQMGVVPLLDCNKHKNGKRARRALLSREGLPSALRSFSTSDCSNQQESFHEKQN